MSKSKEDVCYEVGENYNIKKESSVKVFSYSNGDKEIQEFNLKGAESFKNIIKRNKELYIDSRTR